MYKVTYEHPYAPGYANIQIFEDHVIKKEDRYSISAASLELLLNADINMRIVEDKCKNPTLVEDAHLNTKD